MVPQKSFIVSCAQGWWLESDVPLSLYLHLGRLVRGAGPQETSHFQDIRREAEQIRRQVWWQSGYVGGVNFLSCSLWRAPACHSF